MFAKTVIYVNVCFFINNNNSAKIMDENDTVQTDNQKVLNIICQNTYKSMDS